MIQIPNHTLETLIRQLPIVFESVPREPSVKTHASQMHCASQEMR